jgi:hypothetical protein
MREETPLLALCATESTRFRPIQLCTKQFRRDYSLKLIELMIPRCRELKLLVPSLPILLPLLFIILYQASGTPKNVARLAQQLEPTRGDAVDLASYAAFLEHGLLYNRPFLVFKHVYAHAVVVRSVGHLGGIGNGTV